jgi:hypothetical protein
MSSVGVTLMRVEVLLGIALVGGMLGLGCEIDGSIGRDSSAATGQTDGMVTDAGGPPTEGTADGTADDGAATSVGGGTGGGTGSEGGSADGPTDQPAVCHPTPDDGECARCRKQSCCALYETCLAHDTCLCWWDCLATDHTAEECHGICESDGLVYEELHVCVQMHCDTCPITDAPS